MKKYTTGKTCDTGGTTSDNEWQQMIMSNKEWHNE